MLCLYILIKIQSYILLKLSKTIDIIEKVQYNL